MKLAPGGNFNDGFILSATTPGNAALQLELVGPGDLKIARDFTIGVRPAQAYQLRRFVGRLQPGESVTLDDGAADEFLPGTAEALLSVSPRPDWDVPGLLRTLDRYAYGCLEQTTSRALPLLYVEDVARLWRTDPVRRPPRRSTARSAISSSCSAPTAASACGAIPATRCRGSTPMPPIF